MTEAELRARIQHLERDFSLYAERLDRMETELQALRRQVSDTDDEPPRQYRLS